MVDSRFTEFLSVLDDRIREARLGELDSEGVLPLDPREMAFTNVFLDDMTDIGLISDSDTVYFEKKLGRANGKLNGYGYSEDGAQIVLITTISGGEAIEEQKNAPQSEVLAAIRAALHVYKEARKPFHLEMEESTQERDMVERFHSGQNEVNTIRVLVLINGVLGKFSGFEQPEDLPNVTVDLWDTERLFRAASSGLAYESIAINLEKILGEPLSCLSAPVTVKGHSCYFAVIPGDVLYQLYHEHGPRLLELNVRSFLQARGTVNRGIRDTLQNTPEYFLAYNNGISATVESLDLVDDGAGRTSIRSVTGLQIVNGGQTMASIHRAKDRDKADLSKVYVQAKITKIDPVFVGSLVPMISRFSNTQNKVNETDFSANHPFHVKFQQLSEKVWAPGEVDRWFYERARGQWEVARIREGTTPKKLATFDKRAPRQQKIDKNILAKVQNAWGELPHTVSLGGQKCFVGFMSGLSKLGSKWEPDEGYYRDSVAKVMIFKRAEKIARQIKFSAYQANAVCYTVSLLAYRTAGRINLETIWKNQDVSEALEQTMRNWMPRVHEEIVESAEDRNVTEWCKKKECWGMIQSLDVEFPAGFEEELAAGQPLPNVGKFTERKGAKPKTLSHEERERQAKVMKIGPIEWQEMIMWMMNQPEYAGFPVQICSTILGYSVIGWQKVPSPRQTKNLIEYLDAWNEFRDNQDES